VPDITNPHKQPSTEWLSGYATNRAGATGGLPERSFSAWVGEIKAIAALSWLTPTHAAYTTVVRQHHP
jgi:hypothetical protein